MTIIETLITALILVGIPLLYAILAGIKRLKTGFADSEESVITSKVRKYTVFPWLGLILLYVFWIVAAVTTLDVGMGIILGILLILGMVFVSAVLLPASIYGFILTFAMKKTDKKKYLKDCYRISSIFFVIFALPIVGVAVASLPIIIGL